MRSVKYLFVIFLMAGCAGNQKPVVKAHQPTIPFRWENATVYFALTDRFYNADTTNDQEFGRKHDGAKLRSFEGGDIKGVTEKINDGYYGKLGINALWLTPLFEQIHGSTDEGSGKTYAYHGYWIRDWTSLDPNFGSMEDLKNLVDTAHKHGIRVIMDVVINHTGPVTAIDSQWPSAWVRTGPLCTYTDYNTNVNCSLSGLPDIRTESNKDVDLPEFLVEKWKKEGRYENEMKELDSFFQRTGYPRAPRFYIIKWLSDYVRKLGIDGFRVDTAKHTQADVWDELYRQCLQALKEWKESHGEEKPDGLDFYMVGEVFGYNINNGRNYDYGDSIVDFFNHGFKSLINFGFKEDARKSYEDLFSSYSELLADPLHGKTVLNYISSHDDASPFDLERNNVFEAATKLLLAPGEAQIYYGDETARPLKIPGADGDANLRSDMNWNDLAMNSEQNGYRIDSVFDHWCKLGRFRLEHKKLSDDPYIFERTLNEQGIADTVIVELGKKINTIDVSGIFPDDIELKDYYSDQVVRVKAGKVAIDTNFDIVLLGKPR